MAADQQDGVLLVGVEEAARRLSLGRTLVYELVLRGEIASIKVSRRRGTGRGRRLIPVSALEAYVAAQLEEAGYHE